MLNANLKKEFSKQRTEKRPFQKEGRSAEDSRPGVAK